MVMDDAVIPPSAINWPVMVSPERLAFEDSSAPVESMTAERLDWREAVEAERADIATVLTPVEVAMLLTCACRAVEPDQFVAVVAVLAVKADPALAA